MKPQGLHDRRLWVKFSTCIWVISDSLFSSQMALSLLQNTQTPSSDDVTLYPDHVVPLHVGEWQNTVLEFLEGKENILLHKKDYIYKVYLLAHSLDCISSTQNLT